MNIIVHMTEIKPTSTIASARVAKFISETLGVMVVDTKGKADLILPCDDQLEHLIIVNGPMAFCDFLPQLGELVRKAKKVIWVQQDYTISPPAPNSKAESPFRKAFADRHLRPNYWTTVTENVSAPGDAYINWNKLTYTPPEPIPRPTEENTLLYYGAFREKRKSSFSRYFSGTMYKVKISTTPIRAKKFEKAYNVQGKIYTAAPFSKPSMMPACTASIYIEDDKSHKEFHSPANRFYELLSAGIPILFDQLSIPMLNKAGIYPKQEWIVNGHQEVSKAFKELDMAEVVVAQQKMWGKDYISELRNELLCIWEQAQMRWQATLLPRKLNASKGA